MSDEELGTRLREIILSFGLGMYVSDPDSNTFTPVRWEESPLVDEMVEEVNQAYQEENHDTALLWYEHLLNDLLNDDDLKRTEHVGRILEYARIAAGLTEEDVKITLPDEYIPHDPDLVAKHISPVLEVRKSAGMFFSVPSTLLSSPDTRSLMSGKKWLTRFTKELYAEKQFIPVGMYKLILEIAERTTNSK